LAFLTGWPVVALTTVMATVPFFAAAGWSNPGCGSVSSPVWVTADAPAPRLANTDQMRSVFSPWLRSTSAARMPSRASRKLGSGAVSGIPSVTRRAATSLPLASPYFATRAFWRSQRVAVQISPSACTSGPVRS
jgi:hypothetical protein